MKETEISLQCFIDFLTVTTKTFFFIEITAKTSRYLLGETRCALRHNVYAKVSSTVNTRRHEYREAPAEGCRVIKSSNAFFLSLCF